MAKLGDFRVLSFDCYGTIIDWESGMIAALQPLLDRIGGKQPDRRSLLQIIHSVERRQQEKTPDMPYSELLATMHPDIAAELGLPKPPRTESKAFGDSVGQWPAFPDSVEALQRLSKRYKLVILSNVDHQSFAATNAGPLEGIPFDLILTAQDIGSYKPNPQNFRALVDKVNTDFGIDKSQILQTAQSQFHDHHPAQAAGIKSAWIVRPGGVMGNLDTEIYDWKFDTLGEMADAVEREAC